MNITSEQLLTVPKKKKVSEDLLLPDADGSFCHMHLQDSPNDLVAPTTLGRSIMQNPMSVLLK